MSGCLRSTIGRWQRSWSRAQTSDALTRTLCAATSTSPSRSSSLPSRSSASVGVRVEQRLLQLAVLAPVTDRGRTLRLLAERADVYVSIAALCTSLWRRWHRSFVLLQSSGDVRLQKQADEATVRRGDRRALELVTDHLVQHLMERDECPERARRRPHGLLDQKLRILFELLGAQQSKHHPLVVDHYDGIPSLGANPRLDVPELLLQAARGYVLARDVAGARMLRIRAFGRKTGRHPVVLAVDVVVDVAESERLEPPRGSGRHVSSRIPAVHDHWSAAIEHVARL